MKFNFDTIVHNKFKVDVVDSETGRLKQQAFAFNVVTDTFFKVRCGYYEDATPFAYPYSGPNYIKFGTGNGTPAITDTVLFTYLGQKECSVIETNYSTSPYYVKRQIKLEVNEYNGYTLTEVGLAFYSHPSWGADSDYLFTHAMLKNKDGQQISITKTNTDVVYITSIFYCTVSESGFGTYGIYPSANHKGIASFMLGQQNIFKFYCWSKVLNHSDSLENQFFASKDTQMRDGVGVISPNFSYTPPEITILDSEWNDRIIKTIGWSDVGAFTFPDSSIMMDIQLQNVEIGIGDGVTTIFNAKYPVLKSDSETIYIDDVALQSTDYTLDVDSNCNDELDYYTTTNLEVDNINIKFGNMETQSPSTSDYYKDPFLWNANSLTEYRYPASVNITEEYPVYVNFQQPRSCNKFIIDPRYAWNSTALSNIHLQVSDDNSVWSDISFTYETQSYYYASYTYYRYIFSFDLTTSHYWRFYSSDNSLFCRLYTNNPYINRDYGLTTVGCCCFLGKSSPGLIFNSPPANGSVITADYTLNVPYKNSDAVIRASFTIHMNRGSDYENTF